MQEVVESGIMTMQHPLLCFHGLCHKLLSVEKLWTSKPCTLNFQNLAFKGATGVSVRCPVCSLMLWLLLAMQGWCLGTTQLERCWVHHRLS